MSVPEGMEFNKSYPIIPEDEERMNIIGQNGNTGEHYNDELEKYDLNKDGKLDGLELLIKKASDIKEQIDMFKTSEFNGTYNDSSKRLNNLKLNLITLNNKILSYGSLDDETTKIY